MSWGGLQDQRRNIFGITRASPVALTQASCRGAIVVPCDVAASILPTLLNLHFSLSLKSGVASAKVFRNFTKFIQPPFNYTSNNLNKKTPLRALCQVVVRRKSEGCSFQPVCQVNACTSPFGFWCRWTRPLFFTSTSPCLCSVRDKLFKWFMEKSMTHRARRCVIFALLPVSLDLKCGREVHNIH